MDATTWSSRRRPQPCLLSRCSSCYRARSYSQLWVTAWTHRAHTAPCSSPACSWKPQPCAWAQAIVCAAQNWAESSRGVSDATFASLQSYPLITEELWDSGLQVEAPTCLFDQLIHIPEVLSGSIPVDPVLESCFALRWCWLPWTKCVALLDWNWGRRILPRLQSFLSLGVRLVSLHLSQQRVVLMSQPCHLFFTVMLI